MIRAIRDLVPPEDVGVTLPHEHVLHSIGAVAAATVPNDDLEIRFEELVGYRRTPFAHGGRNLLLQNEDEAFRELERMQLLRDGKLKPLVVDVTLPAEGRDVFVKERLHLAERLKNLNLLTVTTFAMERITDEFAIGLTPAQQSERIAKTLEAELMFGMEGADGVAFPGAIYQQIHAASGELGAKDEILAQGLALVQARTQAPLYLSFSHERSNLELEQTTRSWIRALLDAGAESRKLVVCHADRWCRGLFGGGDHAFLMELLHLGVSVLFDMAGLLVVSDVVLVNPCCTNPLSSSELVDDERREPPPDSRLVEWVAALVKDTPQYLHQLLLSTNLQQRIQYRRYGGGGYTYLFEHFKHRLLRRGVTAEHWDQIVRHNAVSLLSWYVAPKAPPIPKNYLQCSICGNFFEPIEGEYFTKFAFTYCGTKCLRRHSRQKFAPLPTKT